MELKIRFASILLRDLRFMMIAKHCFKFINFRVILDESTRKSSQLK